MPIRIQRIKHLPNGEIEIFVPARGRDGMFTLAKPGAGHERNHTSNAFKVKSLEDAARFLREECSIRLKSRTSGKSALCSLRRGSVAIT